MNFHKPGCNSRPSGSHRQGGKTGVKKRQTVWTGNTTSPWGIGWIFRCTLFSYDLSIDKWCRSILHDYFHMHDILEDWHILTTFHFLIVRLILSRAHTHVKSRQLFVLIPSFHNSWLESGFFSGNDQKGEGSSAMDEKDGVRVKKESSPPIASRPCFMYPYL